MFSSSLSFVLFNAVLIGSIVHAIPISTDSCEHSVSAQDTCNFGLSVPHRCKSSTLNITNSNVSTSCSSIAIFWSYPMNNLTLIIETPFTQEHQPYCIHLQSEQLETQMSHIYQVSKSGEHTELKPQGDIMAVKSNEDYQVILQFQAPTELTLYGTFIRYDVVKD